MRKFNFSLTAPREPESDQLHEENPSTKLTMVRAEQKGNRPTATHNLEDLLSSSDSRIPV